MTKYFCDRCKKVSDCRPEYVSIPDRGGFWFRGNSSRQAELCGECLIQLLKMFDKFMGGYHEER